MSSSSGIDEELGSLQSIGRSLQAAAEKIAQELCKTVQANFADVMMACYLGQQMREALADVQRSAEKIVVESGNNVGGEMVVEATEEIEEELRRMSVQEDDPILSELSGPLLEKLHGVPLLKKGIMNELSGSMNALQSKPVLVLIFQNAVVVCHPVKREPVMASAAPKSPAKKIFGGIFSKKATPTTVTSANQTASSPVDEKYVIQRYLPLQDTTLFDIADAPPSILNCIKLKAGKPAGEKAESVLLQSDVKDAWVDSLKTAIDDHRESLSPRPAIVKPMAAKKKLSSAKLSVLVEDVREKNERYLQGMLDDLTEARHLCHYEQAIEHIDKLQSFTASHTDLSNPQVQLLMAEEVRYLIQYLLAELTVCKDSAIFANFVGLLTQLKQQDQAREHFLQQQSAKIRLAYEDLQFSASDLAIQLCSKTVDLLLDTSRLYRAGFEAKYEPAMILWMRLELVEMLEVCSKMDLAEDLIVELESIVGRLSVHGFPFVFLVRQQLLL